MIVVLSSLSMIVKNHSHIFKFRIQVFRAVTVAQVCKVHQDRKEAKVLRENQVDMVLLDPLVPPDHQGHLVKVSLMTPPPLQLCYSKVSFNLVRHLDNHDILLGMYKHSYFLSQVL